MEIHAVGARLLREYADAIGLDRAFTIHDREDSADLMNLVRHDLGPEKPKPRTSATSSDAPAVRREAEEDWSKERRR